MSPLPDVNDYSCMISRDDFDDDCVSDLSDDDSNSDCYVGREPTRSSTRCIAVMKCLHPSMVPEGVKTLTGSTKSVLVLTNVSSMQSLTAGSEKDDAPRIPSRTNISSASTSALKKYDKSATETLRNANWNDFQKPAGQSSNLFLSRIQASSKLGEKPSMNLNRNLFSKATAEGPSPFQNLQSVSLRRPPSRTDLRSASTPTLQYGVSKAMDYRNATWNDLPSRPLVEQQSLSSPLNNLVRRSSNTVTLTPKLKNKLPHVHSVTSLSKLNLNSDSLPRLPSRTQFT